MNTNMKKLRKFAKDNDNKLVQNCIEDLLEKDSDYDEGFEAYINEVLELGCQSGIVGSLIYYSDTTAFYEKYKEEINALLYEAISDAGLTAAELFGDKWDEDDPLAIETSNQNLLAWFGYEETIRNIANEIGLEV